MLSNRILVTGAACALATFAGCEQRTASNTPSSTTPTATPTHSDADNTATPTNPDADNTARNQGDGEAQAKTSFDQSESAEAIKTTADIRRAILDVEDMSSNAKNCKVITDASGLVTLRGVVETQLEKDAIDAIAKNIAGASRVDNQLEVKAG
jgi:hypothetical protein